MAPFLRPPDTVPDKPGHHESSNRCRLVPLSRCAIHRLSYILLDSAQVAPPIYWSYVVRSLACHRLFVVYSALSWILGNYKSSSLLFAFRGFFYNSATQRKINENTHSREHGIGYYGHYYKRNAIKMKSNTPRLLAQFIVLLFGNSAAVPPPLRTTRANDSRTILAMCPTVPVPLLRAVGIDPSWPIFPM